MKNIKILLIITSIFILTACDKKEGTQVNVEAIGKEITDKTKLMQEDVEIRGIAISSAGTTNSVSATLENIGAEESTFEIFLYFKDKEGKILDKNSVKVEKLQAKKKKSIMIQIIGSYEELSTYELIIKK